MKLFKFLALLLILFFSAQIAFAQGGYGDYLYKEVDVINPVYMPVIGLGAGIINYYGELSNDYTNLLHGNTSYRFNASQYVDKKHLWKMNLNATLGSISGSERNFVDTSMNANFSTDMFAAGLNAEYSFGNIYKGKRRIVPFISLGIEYITKISVKTDLRNDDGFYRYYHDGTIRVGDQLVSRNYDYETNFKDWDPYENSKAFSESTAAIVADLGFDFKISNRVALRLASSLHYTFIDDLDGISKHNTVGRIGDDKNDMFSFTYVSINLDLFSDPKTMIVESYFADITGEDFDQFDFADDDRDGVFNISDDCLDTPRGVAVDSVGCPADDDNDGVPNYKDKEQFSNKGAIVDEFGAELSANKIRESLYQDLDAVNRTEVYMVPVGMGWSKYDGMTELYIPEKFKKLDTNGDHYISFDELIEAINGFFDSDSEYTTDDIYDLNKFFFAQ